MCAGCIATLRAGAERKTENRIGSSAASARTCFDDDGDDDNGDDDDGDDDDGDDDDIDNDDGDNDDGDDYHHYLGDGDDVNELNSVFELTHYDNDKATMMTR